MKLTNRLNLPEPLVEAVKRQTHNIGISDISITELIGPPQIAYLEKKHEEEITEDASDRIFSLLGQIVHGILEKSDSSGVTERRLDISVEGWKVSGQMDRYCDGVLQDYKLTTLWKFKNAEVSPEFSKQLNCYAEILRQNHFPVKKLQIVGILRDWSMGAARRDPQLPQQQVIIQEVPLWGEEFTRNYIRERVILHQQARLGKVSECTKEDRWAKPEMFAVMKKGLKRAVRLYEKESDAVQHQSLEPNSYLERRPGESTRCENWCSVSRWCPQFQKSQST